MIAEVISFMGTSVGGAAFGQLSSFLSSRAKAKSEAVQLEHSRTLAISGALKDYHAKIQEKPDNSFSHTIEFVLGVLALTYCGCTALCFLDPSVILYVINPEDIPRKINFLWGIFSIDRHAKEAIEISSGGVGLMLCYPLVFILSAVCTGIVPRKMR